MADFATPADAIANWPCPLARTFAGSHGNCLGDDCPLWRWLPLQATDPRFVEAIKEKTKGGIQKGGMSHKAAVDFVMKNRAELGLPEHPEVGWCGLGGKPAQ